MPRPSTQRRADDSQTWLDLPPTPSRTKSAPSAPATTPSPSRTSLDRLPEELSSFHDFGSRTVVGQTPFLDARGEPAHVPSFTNEFWTARQRGGNSLHEISYRACFKPELPRFFIERLTDPGDVVYDPFMGRGTTPLEAALLGRIPFACDVNPLSRTLTRPRLHPPTQAEVEARVRSLPLDREAEGYREDLHVFYHPDTLRELVALRGYLLDREQSGALDPVDDWIRMVALNRLTGHSNGFFSVYTLPPNQATSIKAQSKINADRKQTPPRRDVRRILLKKSRSLLSECLEATRATLGRVAPHARLLTGLSHQTPDIPSNSVQLVVTSPPFLDVVNYAGDNWLRCWFINLDAELVEITTPKRLDAWQEAMTAVFRELHRVLKPGGCVAFEVGEVRRGTIRLEEAVLPCGVAAGLVPQLILVNQQEFTKTANCWGVDNGVKGTNTNRLVLFRKAGPSNR